MVNLLGIRTGEQNQSLMLIAEADEHLWIPVEVLRRNLSRPSVPAQTATPATAVVVVANATRGSGTAVRAVPDPKPADDTGRRLGAQWLNAAAPSDRARLRDALERGQLLPPDIDRWLLLQGERTLGPLRDNPQLRLRLRDAFRAHAQEGLRS